MTTLDKDIETVLEAIKENCAMDIEESKEYLEEIRERVREGENPEEILHDEFGLEPDYIFALI